MKFQRLKDMAAVFVIIFLLPYVVSMILSGIPKKKDNMEVQGGQTVCVAYETYRETLPLEQYLTGVLAAQIPVEYHAEAIKAQAVLARTCYELHEKEKKVIEMDSNNRNFLSKEEMKNLWGAEYEENYQKLEQAVIDTAGICMYYKGEPAEPYFHSVSAGMTRSGKDVFARENASYLKAVSCEKDMQADNYITIRTFTMQEIEGRLAKIHVETGAEASGAAIEEMKEQKEQKEQKERFRVIQKDEAGYVTMVEVDGTYMHGEAFRKLFELPSAAFQVEDWESGVRFVCRGLGHGFGMSLNTAETMARNGKSYEEILNYFFDEIVLQ